VQDNPSCGSGAAGAGKTVLLSRLVVDLLDQIDRAPAGPLPAGARVPVLLSLPACDLGDTTNATSDLLTQRLDAWIIRRLVEDYQLRAGQAAALVGGGRILPVLDGLDEMDPAPATADPTGSSSRPRAVAVLAALNTAGRWCWPAGRGTTPISAPPPRGTGPCRPCSAMPVMSVCGHWRRRTSSAISPTGSGAAMGGYPPGGSPSLTPWTAPRRWGRCWPTPGSWP
jgi:hypothetical protein